MRSWTVGLMVGWTLFAFGIGSCGGFGEDGAEGDSVLATMRAAATGLCDPANPIHNCPSMYCSASSDGENGLKIETNFGANEGNLRMFKYVPSNLPANAPLVVALHSCMQDAADYAARTGWNKLADKYGFAVLYPEQKCENNAMCCFNWAGEFSVTDNMIRGKGENRTLIDMIDKIIADHGLSTSRVYVTGASGGGAETALLLATWPDRFEAGATLAGIPYYCTPACEEVSTPCLTPGKDRTPEAWADLVLGAYASVEGHVFEGRYPRMAVWHGTLDTTVGTNNLREMMEQWTSTHGIDQTADVSDTVKGHAHKEYKDANGNTMVETYEIKGGQHAIPVDPGTGEDQCGSVGSWAYDKDICSSYYIAKFFGLLGSTTDQPPSVKIIQPSNGAQVGGVVTIKATAADDVGVTKVEFSIDGDAGAPDSSEPYEYQWDTTALPDGNHTVRATAYDSKGQTASDQISVSKGGTERPPEIHLVSPRDGASVCGKITIAATASGDRGVAKVEFFVDGQSVFVDEQEPFFVEWDTAGAASGSHQISAKAFDPKGLQGSDSRSVRIGGGGGDFVETFSNNGPDSADWQLQDWKVDAEDFTGGGSKSLAGAAEPSVDYTMIKATSIELQLGSKPILSYYRKLDMSCGTYACSSYLPSAFRVKVRDAADSNANEDIVDVYDLIESGKTYSETTWTERSGIDLSAYAGKKIVLFFKVGAPFNSHAKAWIDNITITGDGSCTAIDPPTVTVGTPTPDACCVQLGGTVASPVGSPVVLLAVAINESVSYVQPTAEGAWNLKQCSLPNGEYNVVVTAINALGGKAGAETNFSISDCGQGGAPLITVGSATPKDKCVTIEGTVTDPDGDTVTATISLDGGFESPLALGAGGAWKFERCELVVGPHQATIKAVDATGLNATPKEVSFEISPPINNPPVVKILSLTTQADCVYAVGTATDPDGDGMALTIVIDEGAPASRKIEADGSWSYERCVMEEGDHYLRVKVVDSRGEKTILDKNLFHISPADAPLLTIESLTVNFNCVYLKGTATDPNGSSLTVTVTIDVGAANAATLDQNGEWRFDQCDLSTGEHRALVKVVNQESLEAKEERSFEISDPGALPVVTIAKVAVKDFCVKIEGTATDPDGDALTLTIAIDGGVAAGLRLQGNAWSHDWCGSKGKHEAVVRATDSDGNMATGRANFEIQGGGSSGGCATTAGADSLGVWLGAMLSLILWRWRGKRGRGY